MDAELANALAPVLRDVAATGVPEPDVEDRDWAGDLTAVSAMLWSADGSGAGVRVERALPEADRIATVADQVQEWVIEQLWSRAATNWPPCPAHPGTHPLTATVRGGRAVWACPRTGAAVVGVGSLG